jgi:hypothetical protein
VAGNAAAAVSSITCKDGILRLSNAELLLLTAFLPSAAAATMTTMQLQLMLVQLRKGSRRKKQRTSAVYSSMVWDKGPADSDAVQRVAGKNAAKAALKAQNNELKAKDTEKKKAAKAAARSELALEAWQLLAACVVGGKIDVDIAVKGKPTGAIGKEKPTQQKITVDMLKALVVSRFGQQKFVHGGNKAGLVRQLKGLINGTAA